MRKYQPELKVYLRDFLLPFRRNLNLTQEQMAAMLHMTPRSYSDIERGKSCLSSVSLVFLLYNLPSNECSQFINTFVDSVLESEVKEAV